MFALIGLSSGVSLSERPDVVDASLLTRAYYALGLFVVGGLDIGIPVGGPALPRYLMWISYFGSPILAASALLEAVLSAMVKQRWHLRRMKNHTVIVGSGEMTTSYLRVLRARSPRAQVVVVDAKIEPVRELELIESFGVTVVIGDVSHEFLLRELRLEKARRVLLLGGDDFLSFEAASKILRLYPNLNQQLVIHCTSLRFLRAMQDTRIARQSIRFNSYNLAATALVRDTLLDHFQKTLEKDTIVLAGFGLFGQTILEGLQAKAHNQIDTVAIMDLDAHRRIQVVEEQRRFDKTYHREVFQGDIAHPDVWRQLVDKIDLSIGEPVLILGTGDAATNLRTALWLKQKYPNALVFSRTNDISEFALEIGADHDINCISITHLVETNIPEVWLN